MKYLLIVKGDTNDADYIEEVSEIDEQEIDKIKRIATAIAEYTKIHQWGHNWPMNEYDDTQAQDMYAGILSEDDVEFMCDFIPYGEDGIHSIESIRLLKVEEDTVLL